MIQARAVNGLPHLRRGDRGRMPATRNQSSRPVGLGDGVAGLLGNNSCECRSHFGAFCVLGCVAYLLQRRQHRRRRLSALDVPLADLGGLLSSPRPGPLHFARAWTTIRCSARGMCPLSSFLLVRRVGGARHDPRAGDPGRARNHPAPRLHPVPDNFSHSPCKDEILPAPTTFLLACSRQHMGAFPGDRRSVREKQSRCRGSSNPSKCRS